jgi:hypothetical protein
LRARGAGGDGAAAAAVLPRAGDRSGSPATAGHDGASPQRGRVCRRRGQAEGFRPAVVAGDTEAEQSLAPHPPAPRAVDATPSEADLQADD